MHQLSSQSRGMTDCRSTHSLSPEDWKLQTFPPVSVVEHICRQKKRTTCSLSWFQSSCCSGFPLFTLRLDFPKSDVEAQQVTDHCRHSRQDDHFGDVVDQRIHSQTQKSEWSVQLLHKFRCQLQNIVNNT